MSWRRVRIRKNDPKITLPVVPDSERIDQAYSKQVVPPRGSDDSAVQNFVAPSRRDVAAAERSKHGRHVARLINEHDGWYLRAHREDDNVMGHYGDPDHDPHYQSKQAHAMEDSRWNLMRPRLDHYARAAFPRLDTTDADFADRYRTTEARLDRLERYVGQTDCEALHVKFDHDIDELDERLRVVRPESLDFEQQLRQLNKEFELDKLLLVRYFFLHHVTQRHGPAGSTRYLDLTEEEVRQAYRDAVQESDKARAKPHMLVDQYELRTQPSQARYWSVYLAHVIERQYRSLTPDDRHAELMRERRVVTHKVVSRVRANPPMNADDAQKELHEAYADMRAMTPEALKRAYFMLSGGRNRPASVADSTHTDTATERSVSPPPDEPEHEHEHAHDGDISPRTRPADAGYFRHHHPHDGSERRPPTPYPPPQPADGSISPLSSHPSHSSLSSGAGVVPLLDRPPPPSLPFPPHRASTPLDPLAAVPTRPHVASKTSRWFRGASGQGPSDWQERGDAAERRLAAPKNVPTHAALRRMSMSRHQIPDEQVPERSSSLPQRRP
ncbi:uncharacterized protein RHOBADRAFT_52331 [Rhodotorula graminis WP1]|uniref:Uncharacterized protein n=1 Tax=Rhodotorula graminis (strain WP1) TaxID=578459 RepID=A0A194SA79_RHOGW|nr:uncharacterized protein RHOBADRAFT_52331 [Rhodotorula graminis WP1]KPV76306.1 hypothetical protein RHOBADRAFT_52331 [Rhodotorula graminis WP1]